MTELVVDGKRKQRHTRGDGEEKGGSQSRMFKLGILVCWCCGIV